MEGNGWRKEGVENIYSLISQSLWTRFSDDLTCGAAFTEDVVHTVCLLLDTRKGTFLQLLIFFFLNSSEENLLSSSLLLPRNSLLLKCLLYSLQISWLIPHSEVLPTASQVAGKFLAQKGESQLLPRTAKQGRTGQSRNQSHFQSSKRSRSGFDAGSCLWHVRVYEGLWWEKPRIIGITQNKNTQDNCTERVGKQQLEALVLPGREGMK